MIFALLIILTGAACLPGWFPGMVALAAALYILLEGVFVELTVSRYLLILTFAVAAPAAAYAAGALLDTFAARTVKGNHFRAFAAMAAFCLMLRSERLLEHLEAALTLSAGASVEQAAALGGAVLSAIVFCGGATAFVLIVIHLVCELPMLWIKGAFRAQAMYAFAAMRPLSVIIAVAFFFNLILQRFAYELGPQVISANLNR